MPLTPTEEVELLALLEAEDAHQAAEAQAAEAGGWDAEEAKCAADPLYWIDRWVYTFDPRLIGRKDDNGVSISPFVSFKLFPKQREAVLWIIERIRAGEEGLWEKSRDTGATYVMGVVFLWFWKYEPGFKGTFGSRVEDLVDKKDNPDSIFAKLRIMLYRLPKQMMPAGFNPAVHDNYMRLVNPANEAVITGEGGKNMGRGGRSTCYCLDEAAFVEGAETVEASLSGNTDCVIWVSSVNGMGNLFARKRHGILKPHQIFRMHWRDDPRKTQAWATKKEASFTNPSTWASEYDIDYTASVEGICIPALWVESAKRLAQLEPNLTPSTVGTTGLDVGAGKSKSVAITRNGPVVRVPASRGAPDTTETAYWGLEQAKAAGATMLNFDAPGVGAGVSSTLNHNTVPGLTVTAVNTGVPPSEVKWPDGRTSEEMFGNQKAEIWWLARTAFQRTHEHVQFLEGKPTGNKHSLTDLVALTSGDPESDTLNIQLSLVKWGRNEKGKIVIETKDALRRRGIASPDYADAFMLTFVMPPVVQRARQVHIGFMGRT
jgi:phage terminase large subunit